MPGTKLPINVARETEEHCELAVGGGVCSGGLWGTCRKGEGKREKGKTKGNWAKDKKGCR